MEFMSKYKYRDKKHTREVQKDKSTIVDTSNYIPTAVQFERMRLAGVNMSLHRNINYNIDVDNMINTVGGIENLNLDNISSLSLGHYADIKDVVNFVNEKSSFLRKKYNTYLDEVQALKKEREETEFKKNYLQDLVNQFRNNPEEFKKFALQNNIPLQ